MVLEAFIPAAAFLGELRVSDLPTSEAALSEIMAWIDNRLELFRVYVSGGNWTKPSLTKTHFSASYESFSVRKTSILEIRHEAHVFLVPSAKPYRGKVKSKWFLSAQGCRGMNGKCVVDNLYHFKPAILPDVVQDVIDKNYGGLSSGMKRWCLEAVC
ncbi:Hypothetical protein PHPALM_20553 [Phytophthora palmivora]|uniref:Uncharacterized protein n=1 Tax=Phytophthora palmivora TaxID=4796 RepID=A0A2P4XEK8_9STRA|nr:Hypothetical protein PHPALM_20553 [Phytophthora palmivora]